VQEGGVDCPPPPRSLGHQLWAVGAKPLLPPLHKKKAHASAGGKPQSSPLLVPIRYSPSRRALRRSALGAMPHAWPLGRDALASGAAPAAPPERTAYLPDVAVAAWGGVAAAPASALRAALLAELHAQPAARALTVGCGGAGEQLPRHQT